jgi:hypothetical protein
MRIFILKCVFVSACFLFVYGCGTGELYSRISALQVTPFNGSALDGGAYNQANDRMVSGMIFIYEVQPIDQFGDDSTSPYIDVYMYLDHVDDFYRLWKL